MKKIAILLTLSMMLAGCTDLAEDTTESSVLTNQDLDGVYHGMMWSMRVSMNADDTFELFMIYTYECFDTNAEAQEAIDEEYSQLDDEYEYYDDDTVSEYTYIIINDVCVAAEFSMDDDEEIIYEAEFGISGLTPTLSIEISEGDNPHFVCDDGDEIPRDYVNDGYDDCEGGEDEAEGAEDDIVWTFEPAGNAYFAADGYGMIATNFDSEGTFVCDDGEEIPEDWVNDNYDDCEGGEDEAEGAEDEIEGDEGELMCMHLSPTGMYGLMMDAVEILEDESDFDAEDESTIPASVTALFATHEANYAMSPVSSMAEGCEDVSFIEGVLFSYIWANSLAEGSTGGDPVFMQFSVNDASGTPTEAGGESLIYVSMDSGDDIQWSTVSVQLSIDSGPYAECTNPDQASGSGCAVSDNDDGKWGFGEEVTISEGSDDLCSNTCTVQVRMIDRSSNNLMYESTEISVS